MFRTPARNPDPGRIRVGKSARQAGDLLRQCWRLEAYRAANHGCIGIPGATSSRRLQRPVLISFTHGTTARHEMDDRTARDLKESWSKPAPETQAPVSRPKRILGWGVALLLVVAAAWWIHTRPAAQPAGGRFNAGGPMSVVAATATQGDIDITLNALGTVTPLATVTVSSQISGQLVQVAFRKARWSRRAICWREIDPAPTRWRSQQAQGKLARDQALLAGRAARSRALQDAGGAGTRSRSQQDDTQAYAGSTSTRARSSPTRRCRHRQAQPRLLPHRGAGRAAASGCARSIRATTCTPSERDRPRRSSRSCSRSR